VGILGSARWLISQYFSRAKDKYTSIVCYKLSAAIAPFFFFVSMIPFQPNYRGISMTEGSQFRPFDPKLRFAIRIRTSNE